MIQGPLSVLACICSEIFFLCLFIQKHIALPSGRSSEDLELFVCVRLSVLRVCFSRELQRPVASACQCGGAERGWR